MSPKTTCRAHDVPDLNFIDKIHKARRSWKSWVPYGYCRRQDTPHINDAYMVLSMDRVQVYLPWSYEFSPTMMCVGPNLFLSNFIPFWILRFCPSRRWEDEMSKRRKNYKSYFFFFTHERYIIYTLTIKLKWGLVLYYMLSHNPK